MKNILATIQACIRFRAEGLKLCRPKREPLDPDRPSSAQESEIKGPDMAYSIWYIVDVTWEFPKKSVALDIDHQ